MISSLRGMLSEKNGNFAEINVQGVGYSVELTAYSALKLPNVDANVMLYTYLSIKEDSHSLYGFMSKIERKIFLKLIKINGVGPRAALSILSLYTPNDFVFFVMNDDSKALAKAKGIGAKTAQRIIVEIKEGINKIQDEFNEILSNTDAITSKQLINEKIKNDCILALNSLGYKGHQIREKVKNVYQEKMTVENLIKAVLKEL